MRFSAVSVMCILLCTSYAAEGIATAETFWSVAANTPHARINDRSATELDSIGITFEHFSDELGLIVSISTTGDADGQTTFTNKACCGIKDAQQFVRDVRIQQGVTVLPVAHSASGWSVSHKPGANLRVTYRLPATGPLKIDSGTPGLLTPTIHGGMFHLFGNQAFLLPTDREGSDPIYLRLDASSILDDESFASSFGAGAGPKESLVERSDVGKAVYLGGNIDLSVTDTPAGKVGVAYSAMASSVQGRELQSDALAIIQAARDFFNDSQSWYLVSVLGAERGESPIHVGGGTGVTNAFVMFVSNDLNFANDEHREQFRWVLSHEYFHQWNGLTIRVASRPESNQDDQSNYWFSEGFTEFYAMRLLTRAGLQAPARSVDILNSRLSRYAQNSKRDISAEAAGLLFWSDADGEQTPYLRGYLAAWYADMAIRRHSNGTRDLDQSMRALAERSQRDPRFRVNTKFLATYLGQEMALEDGREFERFVTRGGAAPFDPSSFSPCLTGTYKSQRLQFWFADSDNEDCFNH